MKTLFRLGQVVYGWIIRVCGWLQHLFLLIIRLYWGWQFHVTGAGKLEDIGKVTGYFQSLGIPYPRFNAYLAGCTECYVGLLLLAGVASRIITIPLMITMIVAYLTASPEAVKHIFSKPDEFLTADPFLFLLVSLIVFLFGPGIISVDGLIGLWLKHRAKEKPVAA